MLQLAWSLAQKPSHRMNINDTKLVIIHCLAYQCKILFYFVPLVMIWENKENSVKNRFCKRGKKEKDIVNLWDPEVLKYCY